MQARKKRLMRLMALFSLMLKKVRRGCGRVGRCTFAADGGVERW